jgi:hypothetical protein
VLAFLLYRLSCGLLRLLVLAGVDERELEVAVLRHQLRILHRRGKRARYGAADRAFLAAVSRFLPRERWSAFPVVPETLKRWRRQLEARKDPRRRRGPGRPPIDPALRELILRLGRENPRWGYLRIKGELLKLGITVSATTIANVLGRGGQGPAPRRIGPTWGEFLRAQALAFLPTGTSASDFEDRARHESGPAPGPREATGAHAFVEGCRSNEGPAASDSPGDRRPAREEPFLSRLHGRPPLRVVHRLSPGGARLRDGPFPAHLRLVALPEHGRFARCTPRATDRRVASSLDPSEFRRSPLTGCVSIPRRDSALDTAA